LYAYAANAKTHIGILGGKTNLLESCFGAGSFILGAICGIWGLGTKKANMSALLIVGRKCVLAASQADIW